MAELDPHAPDTKGPGNRPAAPRPTLETIPRINSKELLGSNGRVVIEHHGQRYELRETRFGKLILTK